MACLHVWLLRDARLADQDGPGVLLNDLLQDESKLKKKIGSEKCCFLWLGGYTRQECDMHLTNGIFACLDA